MSTKIMAEVAQGYEGKPEYCDLYVKAAAKAGADAVKFQMVYADDTAVPGYQYYDFFKTLEMDVSVWQSIKQQCEILGIQLFTDISGERALAMAEKIRPHGIKIHTSNFFNRRLIQAAASITDTLFVSIGGAEITEVQSLVQEIDSWGMLDKLTLLYGFQAEPTPVEKSCLARLSALKQLFPAIPLGYLDHAPGDSDDQVHVSLMAMAMGVDWIEKHLTLSRFLEIEDYLSALRPDEFSTYVVTLRRLFKALGNDSLDLTDEERVYRDKSMKKVIAARALAPGVSLKWDDLILKRTPKAQQFEGFHDPRLLTDRLLTHPLAAGDVILKEHIA